MHVNQQAREWVRDALSDAGEFASISTNRSNDLLFDDLPAAVIGTATDEVERATKDGHETRVIALSVVIVADGESQSLDDDLDALRTVVEKAVSGDMGGLAHRLEHTGGELDMGTDEDGDRWYAFLALGWDVEIWTEPGDPETAL
ncbi:MAG TPA: hypothetical protein VK966_02675 [Longimicrobiales bacterium]|nr:hypothetical protein [Longimicrobiales bacterium]